jgi:uncharacterized protein
MDRPVLPIFPLGAVLFPNGVMPLHIFEERYIRMLRDTAPNDPAFVIALATPDEIRTRQLSRDRIGTACRVSGISLRPDGRSDIVVTGTQRVRIGEIDWSNGYGVGTTERLGDTTEHADEVAASYTVVVNRFERYLAALERLIGEKLPILDPTRFPEKGAWVIGETLTLHASERQRLLEQPTLDRRLRVIDGYLRRELAILVHTGMIGNPVDFPGGGFTAN